MSMSGGGGGTAGVSLRNSCAQHQHTNGHSHQSRAPVQKTKETPPPSGKPSPICVELSIRAEGRPYNKVWQQASRPPPPMTLRFSRSHSHGHGHGHGRGHGIAEKLDKKRKRSRWVLRDRAPGWAALDVEGVTIHPSPSNRPLDPRDETVGWEGEEGREGGPSA
jgi:hypothetical protein